MNIRALSAALMLLAAPAASAQTASGPALNRQEGDFVIKEFVFASREKLPELKLHYTTLGTPKRDASGSITNAVLLLHGTSSSGKAWLTPSLADELYGPGQPLDVSQYFLILPDGVGRGGSSKPGDGLRTKFPHYRYHDIVASEHQLITEGLGIKHLRLVMGSSMGGMHTWMWGYMYPDLMDGLVPIAGQPIEISGRNWIQRRIAIEAIRNDPDWNNGNYEKNPTHFAITAPYTAVQTESVLQIQDKAPTLKDGDALYATEAVMDYNPTPHLPEIKAKLMAINFADDETNPPELGVTEREIKRIPRGQYVLIPASDKTHGHFTHLHAVFWKAHLAEFLKDLPAM